MKMTDLSLLKVYRAVILVRELESRQKQQTSVYICTVVFAMYGPLM